LKGLTTTIKNDFNNTTDILLLGGDNFYSKGLTIKNYTYLISQYNRLFNTINPSRVYAVLGNHDYLGDIRYQINNPDLFTMPNMYYKTTYGKIDVYMIDTMLLEPNTATDLIHVCGQYIDDTLLNPYDEYGGDYDLLNKMRLTMLSWLDDEITKSNANNQIVMVCGHYNILTFGKHRYTNDYSLVLCFLLPLFVKHNVNIYLSGHDHGSQVHILDNIDITDCINNVRLSSYDKEIMDMLYPNIIDLITKSINYKFYNIVSGGCVDTPVSPEDRTISPLMNKCTIYENYTDNLFFKLSIKPELSPNPNDSLDIKMEFIESISIDNPSTVFSYTLI